MYDAFLYDVPSGNGYLLEYDSRASSLPDVPPLLSYLKRHVLRSKVKIREVSEEYDVWAFWGSENDHDFESPRRWISERSGAVEPDWNSETLWPWGTTKGIIHDRRGVGLGRRLLVRKGDRPSEASRHDVVPTEEYTLHRILLGIPEGAQDIVPMQAFPMESNLDVMGALDFRKGCYVGQELTVRTYHTGVIRKRILPVELIPSEHRDSRDIPTFSTNLDIKPFPISSIQLGPRPRGTGKLLSTHRGVGLALLRLEHVAGWEKGILKLELEDEGQKWQVRPRRPEWWPGEGSQECSV